MDSKIFSTIFQSNRNHKKNNKLIIFNKFSSTHFNKKYSDNLNINSNKLLNYNSESVSPKFELLFRNELVSKSQNKKSKTSNKIFQIDSFKYEKSKKNNKNNMKDHKNNLSYFNNDYEQRNLLNSIKSFKSEQNRDNRQSNLIPKNFLFKNYTIGKILIGGDYNKINKRNNLQNILFISRNKNKNKKIFQAKSIPISTSLSKSAIKKYKTNLIGFSFKTNKSQNKKISNNNLKLQNINQNKEKIEEIIKNSKLLDNSLGKTLNNDNKINILNIKNGIFSPIRLKKNYDFIRDIFVNNKK